MLSVLISIYKNENPKFLMEALDSIVAQTFQPSEIVLIKDGPLNDKLNLTIEEFKKRNFIPTTIFAFDENMGLGIALKQGLKLCKFDLVARMDTDDIALPSRFEYQINFLKANPNVSVVGTLIEEFNETPGDLKRLRKLPIEFRDVRDFSRRRNPLNHMTVMFRKKAILSVGSYENVPLFEDYYLWLKVLKKGYQIANMNEVLLYMRTGNNMISRRMGFSYAILEWNFFVKSYKNNLLNFVDFIVNILTRIPLRLLPKSILKFFYLVLLRSKFN